MTICSSCKNSSICSVKEFIYKHHEKIDIQVNTCGFHSSSRIEEKQNQLPIISGSKVDRNSVAEKIKSIQAEDIEETTEEKEEKQCDICKENFSEDFITEDIATNKIICETCWEKE